MWYNSLVNAPGTQRLIWWHAVAVYVIVLYATLPLGRPVITFMREHFVPEMQRRIVMGLFAAVGAGLVVYLAAQWRKLSPLAYVCFAFFLRLYWLECSTLMQYPEERLHFIEYGALALLIHRALSIDLKGFAAYAVAFAIGAVIGYGDEGVQWLTRYLPATYRRYFGWNDVALNALGVLYGLGFLATVLRNKRDGGRRDKADGRTRGQGDQERGSDGGTQ